MHLIEDDGFFVAEVEEVEYGVILKRILHYLSI